MGGGVKRKGHLGKHIIKLGVGIKVKLVLHLVDFKPWKTLVLSRFKFIISSEKIWLNINHITVLYTIMHTVYFKTQRTVIEKKKVT